MMHELSLMLADFLQLLLFIYFGFKLAAFVLREFIHWLTEWSDRRLTVRQWSPLFNYMKGRR